MTKQTMSNISTAIAMVCLIAVSFTYVKRNFGAPASEPAQILLSGDQWTRLLNGTRVGNSIAPVQIVEFADFECPGCGSNSHLVETLLAKHGNNVGVVFQHYPLTGVHPRALAAAIAAECAGAQGHYMEMRRELYDAGPDLSKADFRLLAINAGIANEAAFEECVKDPELARRISDGLKEFKAMGVVGVPTYAINGVLLPVGRLGVERAVDDALKQ